MDTTFLIATLFFPRITLLAYYVQGWMFVNTLPFWGEFFLTAFLPRVLVILYIYETLGTNNPWLWIHVVLTVIIYLKSGLTYSNSGTNSKKK